MYYSAGLPENFLLTFHDNNIEEITKKQMQHPHLVGFYSTIPCDADVFDTVISVMNIPTNIRKLVIPWRPNR